MKTLLLTLLLSQTNPIRVPPVDQVAEAIVTVWKLLEGVGVKPTLPKEIAVYEMDAYILCPPNSGALLCAGLTLFDGSGKVSVYYLGKPCVADSALAHEVIHALGPPDQKHDAKGIWACGGNANCEHPKKSSVEFKAKEHLRKKFCK